MLGDSLQKLQSNSFRCFSQEIVGYVPPSFKFFYRPFLLEHKYGNRKPLNGTPDALTQDQLCSSFETSLANLHKRGGKVDLLVINFGHWTDKAKLADVGLDWKEVFQDILENAFRRLDHLFKTTQQLPPRVFFRSFIALF